MLLTAALSLLAGALTVLAPCVLPFLPVIVGGSLGAGSKRRPFIVAGSLVVSLLVFTLALKATTTFIGIDPAVWAIGSGSLVVALGIVMLLPGIWSRVSAALHLDQGSHRLLETARTNSNQTLSAVLTGAALGPVFSSCSPTYAWVLATVLPANATAGYAYLALYCIGLAATLLAISLLGRRIVDRLGWAANPYGWFQRAIAVLFIIVGLLVATGIDKKVQTWAVEHLPSITAIEEAILPTNDTFQLETKAETKEGKAMLNANYDAPELTGIQDWINSQPQTLQQLRGKVVLVDFWTYSCINCIRTQPYLNAWYDKYHDQGLEIIGVHAPEFAFEKVSENVRKAVKDAQITYPVALDNDFSTWRAYNNRYWPAKYLIGKDGKVRLTHFGEGSYAETETAIRELLGVTGPMTTTAAHDETSGSRSPETYLGSARASGFVQNANPTSLKPSTWTLGGDWKTGPESITAQKGATLSYNFTGKEMFLVLDGPTGATVSVTVDGNHWGADAPGGTAKIDGSKLYRLVNLPKSGHSTLVTLTFSDSVSANAFTFG